MPVLARRRSVATGRCRSRRLLVAVARPVLPAVRRGRDRSRPVRAGSATGSLVDDRPGCDGPEAPVRGEDSCVADFPRSTGRKRGRPDVRGRGGRSGHRCVRVCGRPRAGGHAGRCDGQGNAEMGSGSAVLRIGQRMCGVGINGLRCLLRQVVAGAQTRRSGHRWDRRPVTVSGCLPDDLGERAQGHTAINRRQ